MPAPATEYVLRAEAPSFHVSGFSGLPRGPLDDVSSDPSRMPSPNPGGPEENWVTLPPLQPAEKDTINVALPRISPMSCATSEASHAASVGSRDSARADDSDGPGGSNGVRRAPRLCNYGFGICGFNRTRESTSVVSPPSVKLPETMAEPGKAAAGPFIAALPTRDCSDPANVGLQRLSSILTASFTWPANDKQATDYVMLAEEHLHWVKTELRARCGAVKAYLEIKGKMTRAADISGGAVAGGSGANSASTTPSLPCMGSFHSSGKPIAVPRGSKGKTVETSEK